MTLETLLKEHPVHSQGLFSRLNKLLVTGLGSGLSPRAPGTVGSVAYFLIWVGVNTWLPCSSFQRVVIATVLTGLGYVSIHWYLRSKWTSTGGTPASKDPQEVVIDEWAGLAWALTPVSALSFGDQILALVLFRLFDITKPSLVGSAERLPGAWGVLLDDVVAGLLAAALLIALW